MAINNFSRNSISRRGGNVFSNTRRGGRRRIARSAGASIHPDRFVRKAELGELATVFVPRHRFQDFAFSEMLQKNILDHGYSTPTPIQDQSIKPILEGRDLMGLANTGTGKTAAFLLPILQRLLRSGRSDSALIMVPTRELAVQIQEEFVHFAKNLGISSALCVGGANIHRQISTLNRRPQVIIGTPGRLKDLSNRRVLHLENVRYLVLDEADRMLDMGFIRDIKFLISKLPSDRQSLCFSATMPYEIQNLVYEVLKDPISVSVKTSETISTVEQNIIKASGKEEKIRMLEDLLRKPEFEKVLIFGRTKWGVQDLADSLKSKGVSVESIHGNKSQPQRQRALQAFKEYKIQVLVATDVASRGLDIPDVSHVINFDQPNTYADYVHRIGRTGRAGKAGQALTFV